MSNSIDAAKRCVDSSDAATTCCAGFKNELKKF